MTSHHRLLVAIHDVAPCFETEVDQLLDLLQMHVPLNALSMLVVPNYWGRAPLQTGTPFATRLREWADSGVAMFVHGWVHRDEARHTSAFASWKARHMTAGEGEFLGLTRPDAARRMAQARTLIEDIIGQPAAGFIAPAWLYGPGALAALRESGFPLAEDHMKIWRPDNGATVARGPVLTWASRSRARIASSLFAAAVLPPLLTRLPTVRVAVHPGDTRVPTLVRSIDRSLRRLRQTHRPAAYSELLS